MDRGLAELWTLSITEDAVTRASSLLDEAEQCRASRFLAEAPRAAFVATRGALRQLCATYLNADPKQLHFAVNEHGKPFLPGSGLEFNVSHSGKVAVLGFAWQQPIGVDVERTGRKGDIRRIASRFFHPGETAAIEAAADPVQAFYRCWTGKEAYVKAVGLGLSLGLDTFRVAVEGEACVTGDTSWSLYSWAPAAGYMATAAVHGPVAFFQRGDDIFTGSST
ncbi:MAG: 4'-phosphopantetheinyl transferase superfamily protein [Acidobacteria bacterium]|nr:4'-phosphopantetheinyl transferase superfamily protein [Acidobacteriota bacterium]